MMTRKPESATNDTTSRAEFLLSGMLFLVALFIAASASAQQQDWPGSGMLALRSSGQEAGTAFLLGTDIHMEIQGLSNRVLVHQRFTNTTDQWVEGVYTFPLPEDSAVNSMRVQLDERELIAVIKEKEQARREYDEARQEGKTAALTEQQRANMFTQSVANIAPGETVDVYLQYIQPVAYDNGVFSIRYPMTITPRFSPGRPVHTAAYFQTASLQPDRLTGWAAPTTQVPDADLISPHYLPAGESNQAVLSIELHAGLPLARLNSNSHKIITREESGQSTVHHISFSAGSEPMNRDFELSWQPEQGQTPVAASFAETVDEAGQAQHFVQVMLLPPRDATVVHAVPRELVIVLDTSGSMGGTSIGAAISSVEFALNALTPDDAFNVIEFNSNHRSVFNRPVTATRENLDRARRFVRELAAGGGTNMAPALADALNQQSVDDGESERIRQLVFITDGSVGNEREVFRLIRDQLGKSRLFTVGIGSAPNSYFMAQAAEQGRGAFIFIADITAVETGMKTLFGKLQYPVVTDVVVQWPEGMVVEQYPASIPDLYLGEPLVVNASMSNGFSAGTELTVTGKTGNEEWQRTLSLPVSLSTEPNLQSSGLAALWGRQKIGGLMSGLLRGVPREEVKAAVITVSERFQLLTEFTSFIAVEQKISRPADRSLMVAHVPLDVPRGQELAARLAGQGQGLQVAMPATATGWLAHSFKACVLFIALLVLLAVNNWRRKQPCLV